MEIPFLTKFTEGLKLFLESRRLKWFTLLFFIGAFSAYLFERIAAAVPALGLFVTLLGGIFPLYFMVAAFISLLGLQRFLASEEDYKRSLIYTIIWISVSVVFFLVTASFLFGVFLILLFIGFFMWIGFQGYFSTRTSLSLATSIQVEHRSKGMTALLWIANIFNYVVLIGAFFGTLLFVNVPPLNVIGLCIIGLLIAVFFNLLNGLIITRERNKSTADNLALLGLFVSVYSAYFIYNVLKPVSLEIFDISLLIDISITIFFLLYTMSGIGRSLASRASMDTRFKLSKELAASFTFFIASCYVFVDVSFTTLFVTQGLDPVVLAPLSDVLKLWIFPFIALAMEINFIRKAGLITPEHETPEDLPIVPVEEIVYDESGEVIEEEPVVVEEPPTVDIEEPTDIDEPVDESEIDEPEEFTEEYSEPEPEESEIESDTEDSFGE
ncbi:MAG: hypothetical protein ACW98Y_04285 [Candidatus Thorarchaeota archaeon]